MQKDARLEQIVIQRLQFIYIERVRGLPIYQINQPDVQTARVHGSIDPKERRIEPGETSGGRSKCISKSRPCFLAPRAEYQLHQAVAVFIFFFFFFFTPAGENLELLTNQRL